MSPTEAIDMLDEQLSEHGQDVVLQRLTAGAVTQSLTVRAFVRGYQPDELVNGITQQDAKLIVSPTGLASFNSGAAGDVRVPQKGNRVVIAGRTRSIEAAVGIVMGGELVRIEARVLG